MIEFDGRAFRAKSGFHVTLLGREILTRAGLIDFPDLESAIRSAARGVKFSVDFRDEYWLISEKQAGTIIRMCDVNGADEFYRNFEGQTGQVIERPPYHVTLYTSGTAKGIGVTTAGDLERLGRRLSADDVHVFMRDAFRPSS